MKEYFNECKRMRVLKCSINKIKMLIERKRYYG